MLIATPNLCLDRTVRLPRLQPGAVHRSGQAEVSAGGKGVNVARVLRSHGLSPVIAGLVPDVDGEQLRGLLREEGAELVGVPVVGRTRAASILLEDDGRVTVVNEPGPQLDDATWVMYQDAVAAGLDGLDGLDGHEVLVCTGSLPPGAPADGYGRLTGLARRRGAVTIVDAARDALAAALTAGPDLVCPNLAEAEAALVGSHGGPEHVDEDAEDLLERGTAAARALVAAGAQRAVVTLGSVGAVLVSVATAAGGRDLEQVVMFRAPRVAVVNPVGAGDSLVGGVIVGLTCGEGWVDAVRRGVATASASVEQVRAGGVDVARVDELLAGTQATSLAAVPGQA